MNPYASLYLKVADQYRRDLAHEYRHAQRGWAEPEHRVRAAFGRLRAHGGHRPTAAARPVDSGLQRAHVA